MFTSKPRPVPSKAALRVLYQLAYISSGTAVGAGVLCAEERRRRTRIVQHIADNAKKIRQHPRYVANATLAAREGEGFEEGAFDQEQLSGRRNRFRGYARGKDGEGEGIKGQELPSVVEKEYESAARRRKRPKSGAKSEAYRPLSGLPSSSAKAYEKLDRHQLEATGLPKLSKPLPHEVVHPPARYRPFEPPGDKTPRREVEQADPSPSAQGATASEGLAKRLPPRQPSPGDAAHDTVYTATRLNKAERDRMSSKTQSECKMLLQEGRLSDAAALYLGHAPDISDRFPLADELFDAALSEGLLSICGDLLRVQRRSLTSQSVTSRFQSLIEACLKPEHHEFLLDLCYRKDPLFFDNLQAPRVLNHNSRTILATACSLHPGLSEHFIPLYRSLNEASRHKVDRLSCHQALTITWRSTRDLDAVLAKVQPMRDQCRESPHMCSAIDTAMVDIYIRAHRFDEALETIARIHWESPGSSRPLALAALCFARQRNWEAFNKVLHIGEAAPSYRPKQKSRIIFEGIVHAYSLHHSAAQTWKLVTYLMHKFHFRPSSQSTATMLQSFVSKKAIALIPKWLRLLRIEGYDYEMDARTATKLLKQYYRDHRPSHVLIMWLCRNLVHWAPSFDPNEFLGLVEESIGYDLSGAMGRSAVWQRQHMETRLARLQESNGNIPSPGYQYNRELHFQHPQASTSDEAASSREDSPMRNEAECAGAIKRSEAAGASHSANSSFQASDEDEDVHWLTEQVQKLDSDNSDGNGLPRFLLPKGVQPVVEQDVESQSSDPRNSEEQVDGVVAAKKSARLTLEVQMSVALSRQQYKAVLDLYEQCLDGMRIPSTAAALTSAVRASLKLHGDGPHVQRMVWDAEQAGMDVTPAMKPLLVHRMRNLKVSDTEQADRLRNTTIRFYENSAENNIDPGPHIATTAANSLISSGYPTYGLGLLRSVEDYTSDLDRRGNIVPITIIVKGYTAMGKMYDVIYQVTEVLKRNIRITPGFLHELKHAYRVLQLSPGGQRAHLRKLIELCQVRRADQAYESKIFGKKLVACIANCMRKEETVDADVREELDGEFFGRKTKAIKRPLEESGSEDDEGPVVRGRTRRERLQQNRARIAKAIRRDPDVDYGSVRQAGRMRDVRWLRQYRAFLRKPIVMEDGRHVPYRYRLASESSDWRARESGRQKRQRRRDEVAWEDV